MAPKLTVACVKAKPSYHAAYVNALYAGVRKHLSVPHDFVCFTDDKEGVRCPTKDLPSGLGGWWAKLALFRPIQLFPGLVLYLDLDTVITGSLDFLADYKGEFAILRDFYRPEGYGSGVMLWNEPQPQVWNEWMNQGKPIHPLGDQGWMEETVLGADRLQDLYPGKFVSYKCHCRNGIPKEASVVAFHGKPKPHETELWAA